MPNPRLSLALERMGAEDWRYFEKFAAEFHAVEFPSLRTMAAASGDKGRDGELYIPAEDPFTALQYSVTGDWRPKITATLRRLSETMPSVRQLIYVTNQTVGPEADELHSSARNDWRVSLDIHDASWFIDREVTFEQRQIASEELIARFVEPLLVERRLRSEVGVALTGEESRVALLHLALDAKDEATDKGLTRASYESLAVAAMHDTDMDNRITLDEIVARVADFLPAADPQQRRALVTSALERLSGKNGRIKKVNKTGDYCLSFSERETIESQTAQFLIEEEALEDDLARAAAASSTSDLDDELARARARQLRLALETFLLRRGEAFAAALTSGTFGLFHSDELTQAIIAAGGAPKGITIEQSAFALHEALNRPSHLAARHLQRLADGYTMFAFLRQAPDVQKVVLKVFSEGSIWVDTSAVLPLLAETLVNDEQSRRFTNLMRAAVDAGLRLFVTPGVVEEIERHLNRAVTFARFTGQTWHGRVPFIYKAFALSGRNQTTLSAWLENFRGQSRPEEDISAFLADEFRIETRSLEKEADAASPELRAAIQELWNEEHDRRRSGPMDDPSVRRRLVAHDVENTAGLIQLRGRESSSGPLGYKAWWLTLDRTAYRLGPHLKSFLGDSAPASPVLSPDFFVQVLRLGPLRASVAREHRLELSVITAVASLDLVPQGLLEEALVLRESVSGVSERVIDRRLRDHLDDVRMQKGGESLLDATERQVLATLEGDV